MDCYLILPHLGLRWFDENLFTSLSRSCEIRGIVRWGSYKAYPRSFALSHIQVSIIMKGSENPGSQTFLGIWPSMIICLNHIWSYVAISQRPNSLWYNLSRALSKFLIEIRIFIYQLFWYMASSQKKNNKVIMKTNYILRSLAANMHTSYLSILWHHHPTCLAFILRL